MDIELPGIDDVPERVARKLRSRLKQTKDKGGADSDVPAYTNRLLLEASPYLQQHAHNPVNWYPWGEEAFEMAQSSQKPILLSVGYSTCHWCHVMKRESFEDPDIAEYMNNHYVPVKVDREERPDVDDAYMNAVRIFSRGGGWPMTVFLTPERRPFFGGTYFPPDRFLDLLKRMKAMFVNEEDQIREKAKAVATRINQTLRSDNDGGDVPPFDSVAGSASAIASRAYDDSRGGFGRGQKFPMPSRLQFLLRYHDYSEDQSSLEMATHSLDAMARGGIYDHVGGGFHRYATDPKWRVPHFEKMLYDNTQLATLYTEAWSVTKKARYAEVVEETLRYLERDMSNAEGALYSASNADSKNPETGEQEEGAFFTWDNKELQELLTAREAEAIEEYYNTSDRGNFEGSNIFYVDESREAVAGRLGISLTELEDRLTQARRKLYEYRDSRTHPHRDEKILTAWNGLGIEAYAEAGMTFGKDTWIDKARSIANFILDKMECDNGYLHRTYVDGELGPRGYASDYAFTIAGLLSLFEASGESKWLREAMRLQADMNDYYWDNENDAYFQSADRPDAALARKKPRRDGSVPSANSYGASNLLRFHHFTLNSDYRERAEKMYEYFEEQLTERSLSVSAMLTALYFYDETPLEVAIVKPSESAPDPLMDIYRKGYHPNSVLVQSTESDISKDKQLIPWLDGKEAKQNQTTGYVCREFICQLPTTEPETFKSQL